jgi:ribosome-associated toxin RatA of RatAB toxin-antitoxin module
VRARYTTIPSADLFAALSDFEAHARRSSVVRSVVVRSDQGVPSVSEWQVSFRRGVLKWSEFDEFDPERGVIRFWRRDGDPESFEGTWEVIEEDGTCVVQFRAEFELGIPSFSSIVDPLGDRMLYENVVDILQSFGHEAQILTVTPSSRRRGDG